MGRLSTIHLKDHELVAEAIASPQQWLADTRLLVHIAREHGFRVKDVSNLGLVPLLLMHDHAHGKVCFADAESRLPDAVRDTLQWSRKRETERS